MDSVVSGGNQQSQSPQASKPCTHSNKVAELIISSCQRSDPSARISSVLRDSEGRTIVRMRTNPSSNPIILLRALQALWPLAKCCVQENALDGTVEAEIIVPREKDERTRALRRARKSRVSELLWVLIQVLLFVALIMYANDCYVSFAVTGNRSGTSAVGDHTKDKSEL